MKDAIAYRDHKIQELQHNTSSQEGRVQLEMELSMNQQQVELLTGHTRKTIQVFATRLRMKGLYAYFLSWTAHVRTAIAAATSHEVSSNVERKY